MSSNALEWAKAEQRKMARNATVFMPLDILEALIAEIEHLNAELNETTDLLAKTKSKDAEVSGMVQRIGKQP
jgi:hypothetical protein